MKNKVILNAYRLFPLSLLMLGSLFLSGCQDPPPLELPGPWKNLRVTVESPLPDESYTNQDARLVYTVQHGQGEGEGGVEELPLDYIQLSLFERLGDILDNEKLVNSPVSGELLEVSDNGDYELVLTINTPSGEVQATVVVPFNVDSTPPGITINIPADGSHINNREPVLNYEIDEPNPLIWEEAELDHSPENVANGQKLPVLADGSHAIRVVAFDKAGNRGEQSIQFSVDATNPVGSITAIYLSDQTPIVDPADGVFVDTGNPWLALVSNEDGVANIKEDGALLVSASLTANIEHVEKFGGLAVFGYGMHTVEVEVVDPVGNTHSSFLTFYVDITPPIASISQPNGPQSSPTVNLVYQVTEQNPAPVDPILFQLYWNGVKTGTPFYQGSGTTITLPGDGNFNLEITVTDASGLKATNFTLFSLDTTPPELTVTSPKHGDPVYSNSPILEVTSNEESNYALLVYVFKGAYRADYQDSLTRVRVSEPLAYPGGGMLEEGQHTVVVELMDDSGNLGVAYSTFTVNAVGPEVIILNPDDGDRFARNSISLRVSIHNAADWEVRVNGASAGSGVIEPMQPVPRTYQQTLAFPQDGTYIITVIARDTQGGHAPASDTATISINTPMPAVEITSPNSDLGDFNGSVPVAFMAYNATSASVYLDDALIQTVPLTGATPLDGGESHEFTLSRIFLSEKAYTLRVSVSNGMGGTAEDDETFIVDSTAPEITLLTPANEGTYNTDLITLSYMVTETNTIAAHTAVLDDVAHEGMESGKALPPLLSGAHTLQVIVTDKAGNQGVTDTISFTVIVDDSDPPEVKRGAMGSNCFLTEEPGVGQGMCLKDWNDPGNLP